MARPYTLKLNRQVTPAVHAAAARGLKQAADDILAESLREVPIDEGQELTDSGRVRVDEARLRAAVSYGSSGLSGFYAIKQHEDLSLHHDAGRNGKYLEGPLTRGRRKAGETIARAIRRVT